MHGRHGLPFPADRPIPVFFSVISVLTAMNPPMAWAQPAISGTVSSVSVMALTVLATLVVTLLLLAVAFMRQRRSARAMSERIGVYSNRIEALQQQLIEREKLASLGQLTAGIAHEIKNPLNFVTNFSDVSRELIEELHRAESEEEREEILAALRQNLFKISEHGHRADDIVRGMMLHARGGSTAREKVDINALISESAHLAYHAMRAQQDGFNCTIELDLAHDLPQPPIMRQDIARVLLNILQNAMQAVHQREKDGEHGYAPRVLVRSAVAAAGVEILIRDNGKGIPQEIRERIFEPFFTTKESDKGTGLGLAIAHEIIVDHHDGRIRVGDVPGGGAEFILELPV